MAITKNGTTYSQNTTVWVDTPWTSGSFSVAAGTNRILVVALCVEKNNSTDPYVTGIKWGGSGGVSLTKAASLKDQTYAEVSLWYLVNPTAQTSTLYITMADGSNALMLAATVWDGVDQASPVSGATSVTVGWDTAHPLTVSSASGSLVVDAYGGQINGTTLTCGQTEDRNTSQSSLLFGNSNKAGAASVIMSWTTSGPTDSAAAGMSLKDAVGGGTPINIALAVGGS